MEEDAKDLAQRAKEAAHSGKYEEALALFQMSYDLYPLEKVERRMKKLQEFMDEQAAEEEDGMVDMGKGFHLHESIASNLYDYQKEGVLWFWNLFNRKAGGILGDDMGLGKTIQVIAFLAGMFDAELIKSVIIVAPLAVLVNWENEFKKWAGGIRVESYHGNKKKERMSNLRRIQKKGVLLTTYGMILSNSESFLVDKNDERFVWDYVILDEGHKIKNATKTSTSVRSIHSRYNYILTGTPVQNNLGELWALMDFVTKGQLLGSKKTFETEFQKPIVRARERDADSYSQQVGNRISESLREMIQPYFLRRTKDEIFKNKGEINLDTLQDAIENIDGKEEKVLKSVPKMEAVKNDLVIWVYLAPRQLEMYKRFAHSERVEEVIKTTRSPLTELTLLKKICDHPQLQSTLSKFLTRDKTMEGTQQDELSCDGNNDVSEAISEESLHTPSVEELINDSGKMVFLVFLMQKLKEDNRRTLIFSQSRKMLDIIQKVLRSLDHKILRIDGTISNPHQREKILDTFHEDDSYNVLLMTTQIGCVGLNMTTADRLIIFDPSWNPGTDAQAVDRIYRLGQTRNVVVYRLITCGTVEEKIYRKQIFKNAIMKQTTGSSTNPYRYFTNHQLRELFVLDDPTKSNTQLLLREMHKYSKDDSLFEEHLRFLSGADCLFGFSHHDLLFSQDAVDDKEFTSQEIIDTHVKQASQRVAEERNAPADEKQRKQKQSRLTDSDNPENFNPSAAAQKGEEKSPGILEVDTSENSGGIHSDDAENTNPSLVAPEVAEKSVISEIDLPENNSSLIFCNDTCVESSSDEDKSLISGSAIVNSCVEDSNLDPSNHSDIFQSPRDNKALIESSLIASLGKSYRTPPGSNNNERLKREAYISRKKTSTPTNSQHLHRGSDASQRYHRNLALEIYHEEDSKTVSSLDFSSIQNDRRELPSLVSSSGGHMSSHVDVTNKSSDGRNRGSFPNTGINISSHSEITFDQSNKQGIDRNQSEIESVDLTANASGNLYESLVGTSGASVKSDDQKLPYEFANCHITSVHEPKSHMRTLELSGRTECNPTENPGNHDEQKDGYFNKSLKSIGNVSGIIYECCSYGSSPISEEKDCKAPGGLVTQDMKNSDRSQNLSIKSDRFSDAKFDSLNLPYVTHNASSKLISTSMSSNHSSKISLGSSNQLAATAPVDQNEGQILFFSQNTIDNVNFPAFTKSLVGKCDSDNSTKTTLEYSHGDTDPYCSQNLSQRSKKESNYGTESSLDSSHYGDTVPFCSQPTPEASEDRSYDFARLEKIRKDNLERTKSNNKLSDTKPCIVDDKNQRRKTTEGMDGKRGKPKLINGNYSNISNLFQGEIAPLCAKAAKTSRDIVTVSDEKSSINTSEGVEGDFSTCCENGDKESHETEVKARSRKLKRLEKLLKENFHEDIDDHVLMEIADLVKVLRIGI